MKKLLKRLRNALYILLRAVVQFIIDHDFCNNEGKFVRGELLKYNWKAKIYINTVVKREGNAPKQFEKYIISGQNVEFSDESSCSAFWVRRLYFWEKSNCP